MKKIIICVLSCAKNENRRKTIRETWLKGCEIEYYFFIGDKESQDKENVINLDCDDGYKGCAEKQLKILEYCYNNIEFDYLFQCDDDTYVVIDKFEQYQFVDNIEYLGFPLITHKFNYAHGGAGFFLNKNSINKILSNNKLNEILKKHTFSDAFIGEITKEENIQLTGTYYFNPGKYTLDEIGFAQLLPTKNNCFITAHYITPELMYKTYNHFNNNEEINNIYLYKKINIYEKPDGQWYYNYNSICYGPFLSSWDAEAHYMMTNHAIDEEIIDNNNMYKHNINLSCKDEKNDTIKISFNDKASNITLFN